MEPKCKEINCGSPGRLPNGWLEGARMNLGDVVNFKCVDGMKFEGESLSTTCQVIKKAYLYNKSGASFLNVFVEYIYSNKTKKAFSL